MAFTDGLAAAATSVGGGFVSSWINNSMARRNAREQREWQEKMWEKEKAYNAPGSQANLLRAAGLNPYDKVGFQPIGNAGTGATAETIPFDNPVVTALSTARQFAEIEHLTSQTGKTENESAAILQQIQLDKLAYEQGLLEKDEYEMRLQKLREAYEKYNPFEIDFENKIADTRFKDVQSDDTIATRASRIMQNYSQSNYYDSLSKTEDLLRDAKTALISAQTESAKASAIRDLREAEATQIRIILEQNKDSREHALYLVEYKIKQYAKELGASEAELAKIQTEVAKIWHRENGNDFVNAVLDFIHSNIRLAGSASYVRK